jgi:co-chaperonin GroES (HSP10)
MDKQRFLRPVGNKLLVERVKLQDKVGKLIIPGRTDKVTNVAKVIVSQGQALVHGIKAGDIITTKDAQYLSYPIMLTDEGLVPYDADINLEIVDLANVIAVYREKTEDEEDYTHHINEKVKPVE